MNDPTGISIPPIRIEAGVGLHDIQRHAVLAILNHHNGNRTHTARTLGISIRTLRNYLLKYAKAGHPVPSADWQRHKILAPAGESVSTNYQGIPTAHRTEETE